MVYSLLRCCPACARVLCAQLASLGQFLAAIIVLVGLVIVSKGPGPARRGEQLVEGRCARSRLRLLLEAWDGRRLLVLPSEPLETRGNIRGRGFGPGLPGPRRVETVALVGVAAAGRISGGVIVVVAEGLV